MKSKINFDDGKVFIIAEIGGNHEGDFAVAKTMVREAAATGVDAVKFQTFKANRLTYDAGPDDYATRRYSKLELTSNQFIDLAEIAKKEKVMFLSTPFDLDAVDVVDEIAPAFKVASGDLTFVQLIQKIARKNKPIMLSTGAGDITEIETALDVIRTENPELLEKKKVAVLHCVCSYPTPPENANLNAIPYLRKKLNVPVGYSDHTIGSTAAIAAAALGACVIEKHFDVEGTSDKFEGGIYGKGDHILSAKALEMLEIVNHVRLIEKMLGEFKKEFTFVEQRAGMGMKRCLAANVNIEKGSTFTSEMLSALRPGDKGISAARFFEVLGKKSTKHIPVGKILTEDDFE